MQTSPLIKKNLSDFKIVPNMPSYKDLNDSFSWEEAEKEYISFFEDGTMNAAYNLVDRHAKSDKKDKTALLFESATGETTTYSYETLSKLSNQFASALRSEEVEKGDRVFIFLPTAVERYVVFLGILKTGAIAGTLFAAFQEEALLDRLSDSGAKAVVTNADLYPRIEKIWEKLPHLEKVILVDKDGDSLPSHDNILSYSTLMKNASEEFSIAHMQKTDAMYMLYTSGTTGKPKGVVHAHADVLQDMMTSKYVLDLKDEDVYWCTADLGWVTGVAYGVLGPMGLGVTSVYYEGRFTPESWFTLLEKHKVSVWYTAPTAIRMLMGAEIDLKDFDLSSLRHLCSVGEPLNPEAIWWALEKIGLPFHDTWWQTELGGICITNYPILDIKPGSMGKPFPGVLAAVVDDAGLEVADGQEGHLALKPETVSSIMKTVWKNEEKYQSYFSNGWYISGDKAYKDEDGYFWFIGRADDVIKTMGERVGPFEVESSLVEHPSVVEAGVIGKPDELRGEIIKAFVVLKPGITGSDELIEELKQHVKKHLAGHAYPREIEFIDKLPKTRSGKIMRRVLKAQELGLPIGDISTLEDY
ncbi:MAG TPA: acetate--CoA ligase [Patescibacteria group bacterium]|nr:acetate--CoA ligase [Patescibacteria group bacterium]